MSTLQKIAKITQAVLDQVTGADLPTLYYHPHGEIRRVLDYLPQLKEKYRPDAVAVQYTCASFIF